MKKEIVCWKKYHDRYHDEWEQCVGIPLLKELSKMYPTKWIPEEYHKTEAIITFRFWKSTKNPPFAPLALCHPTSPGNSYCHLSDKEAIQKE